MRKLLLPTFAASALLFVSACGGDNEVPDIKNNARTSSVAGGVVPVNKNILIKERIIAQREALERQEAENRFDGYVRTFKLNHEDLHLCTPDGAKYDFSAIGTVSYLSVEKMEIDEQMEMNGVVMDLAYDYFGQYQGSLDNAGNAEFSYFLNTFIGPKVGEFLSMQVENGEFALALNDFDIQFEDIELHPTRTPHLFNCPAP